MKLITAIIQEDKLDRVREELIGEEVYRITVTRVSGRGQQVGEEIYRGQRITPNLLPKVRIDIGVNEEWVERTINGHHQGSPGQRRHGRRRQDLRDPLLECIRIRTGERGGQAI